MHGHAEAGLPAPACSWNEVLDGGVYALGRGVRMFGSRKPDNKGEDVGRVYSLLCVLSDAGAQDDERLAFYRSHTPQLLHDLSIRFDPAVPSSDPASQEGA
jgi:hypothetical protein